IFVWGGILLLVAIVVIEYRAKTGFAASVKALEDAANDITRDVTYADAQGMMQGYTSVAGREEQGHQVHDYAWFSVFKNGDYNIKLIGSRDKEPLLYTFLTPIMEQELIDEEKVRLEEEAAMLAADGGEDAANMMHGAMPGGMGMGMG